MFKPVCAALLVCASVACAEPESNVIRVFLPKDRGALVLPTDGLKTTEASAKPNGRELGVRLHDAKNTEILAFHFLTDKPNQTAESCMADDVAARQRAAHGAWKVEKLESPAGTIRNRLSAKGVSILQMMAEGNKCAVIEIYPDPGTTLDEAAAIQWLNRLQYDAAYQPTAGDKFMYAEVLYRHEMFAAAAPMFQVALDALPAGGDLTPRRVVTDQLGMSLGMSGKVDEARAVFEKAAAADPAYPLYQYNLACADAEQGKAEPARLHLQKAWDLRANVIQGEPFPDPTGDDSLVKLKNDKSFWQLAQSISASLKK